MAVALPLRIYGLDAICAAAASQADNSAQAAQFTRRLFERVADRDPREFSAILPDAASSSRRPS